MSKSIRVSITAAALALFAPLFFAACDNDESEDDEATFTQVDRKGIPALNTVFNHATSVEGFSKRTYNLRGPETDLANYKTQFITVLGAVANGKPDETATLLLPDVLSVKLGSAKSDFAKLDGRDLSDDAVDIALSVTVGTSLSALQSDNVDANDTAFLSTFPYLAGPH